MNGDNAEEPGPHPTLSQVPSFVRPVGGRTQIYAPAAERERVHEPVAWSVLRVPARHRLLPVHRLAAAPQTDRHLLPLLFRNQNGGHQGTARCVCLGAASRKPFPCGRASTPPRVRGFEEASLARRLDGRWLFRGLGALATVRLPAGARLAGSRQVGGRRRRARPSPGTLRGARAREESVAGLVRRRATRALSSRCQCGRHVLRALRTPASRCTFAGTCPSRWRSADAPNRFRSTALRLLASPLRKASNAGPVGTIQVKGRSLRFESRDTGEINVACRVKIRSSSVRTPARPPAPVDHAAWTGRRGGHRRGVAGDACFPDSTSDTPGSWPTPTSCRSHTWTRCCASGPTIDRRACCSRGSRLALGKWSEAEANLRLLVEKHDDAITWRARLALVELERAEVDALPPSDAARVARQAAGVARAAAGRDRADHVRLRERLAHRGSPRWRWRWNHRGTPRRSTNAWRARNPRAGASGRCSPRRWYRAAGHLPESAVAYLAASAAAGPHDDGAADLLAAIDVLRATDDGARALQVIEQAIARWPADRRLLARGGRPGPGPERRPPRPELRGASRRARARRRSSAVAAARSRSRGG